MSHVRQEIKNLKNFASMSQSFKEWLTTCPKEYIWQINEVTKDRGTFTFFLKEQLPDHQGFTFFLKEEDDQ
tara:strand:+ start:216 stop:428 length:213 start_codon:yes stop_codon:yes gene_type:complete